MTKRTATERFWPKVNKSGDCWLWTGARYDGYGFFRYQDSAIAAHRWAYEELIGPVSEGLQLDHLCRNRACVNPDHLEPVTQQENLRRGDGWSGRNARKTHCKRGHEFTVTNTYVRANGQRNCRICRADHARHYVRKAGAA